MALLFLGHLDQAISRTDLALAEARRLSHALTLVQTLGFAWAVSRFVGSEPTLLLQNADEQLALSDERGFAFFRANALVQRGWSLAALGHPDDGIPLITTGLAALRDTVNMPHFLTDLAEAYGMAGQPRAGLECLAEAEHTAEATQTRWALAETLRLRGDLLLAVGNTAAAEASYLKSLALARQQTTKLFELRSATSLAHLWRDQGKRSEAHELFAPVYGWFTEGLDTTVLKDAKALLEELSGFSRSPAAAAIP
jgi:predicted ATPase